jgi:hypothetical protein
MILPLPLQSEEPQRLFDPGGELSPQEYCESFSIMDPHLLAFSTFISSLPPQCERDCDFILRRASWYWPDALDPPERDSLVAINPGFIRQLYHQWSLQFMDYQLPIAVDLLSRYEASCSPFNPIQTSTKLPLPVLPPQIVTRVDQALLLAAQMRQEPINRVSALDFFAEAYTVADRDFGVQEAIRSGNDFQLPTEEIVRDLAAVADCGGSLVEMASRVQRQQAPTRLSLARIQLSVDRLGLDGTSSRRHLTADQQIDFIRLARLAHTGIELPLYEGFTPSSATQRPTRKIRSLYQQVHNGVNRSLVDLFRHHLVLLLPTIFLLRLTLFHFTPIGWTTKEGNADGRNLFDAKDGRGASPLNPGDKEAYTADIRSEWGLITHADLTTICKMILNFEAEMAGALGGSFSLKDVILFKVDLSKAFHLLSFNPGSVPYLASELYQSEWPQFSEEIRELLARLGISDIEGSTLSWSMVYITGSFGLILLPFVFAVVTRCLLILLLRSLHGRLCSYVDDSMGVCLKSQLHHDICTICEVVELLLGPDAVEWKKWFFGRKLVMIGWKVDLDSRLVSLSHKNLMKVAYGFTITDLDQPVKVRWVTKLASWSSRYTQILRALHPCTVSLFAQIAGMQNMEATMEWKADARVAVLIWRAALVLLHLYETEYSLPLEFFRVMILAYEVEYDASLTGLGFLLFSLRDGVRDKLVGCGEVVFPFDCRKESDYQNTCEFIGVLLGLLALAQRGVRNVSLRLCGDSKTSLTWGLDGHFRGKLCLKAALVYILASMLFNIVVLDAVHIPGVDNVICDLLSRQKTTARALGIDYKLVTDISHTSALYSLLMLVDPTSPQLLNSEEDFCTFWRQAHLLLGQISSEQTLCSASTSA